MHATNFQIGFTHTKVNFRFSIKIIKGPRYRFGDTILCFGGCPTSVGFAVKLCVDGNVS